MKDQKKTSKKPLALPDDIEELKALALKLHTQLEERTEQRDNLAGECQRLGEYVKDYYAETHQLEDDVHIRQRWRTSCVTFNQSVLKLYNQWPTPLDTQIFEADDWAYLSQAEKTAQRFLDDCTTLQRRETTGIGDAVKAEQIS